MMMNGDKVIKWIEMMTKLNDYEVIDDKVIEIDDNKVIWIMDAKSW